MIPLNLHSHYSILRGVAKVPDLVQDLKEKGYTSAALIDTSRLYGIIEFYKLCKANDIKPLLGVSLFLPKDHFAEHPKITLIAKNNDGYKALTNIVTKANIRQKEFSEFVVIDLQDIEPYKKDLIVIISSFNSEVSYAKNITDAAERLKKYSGFPNFYIGISSNNGIQNIEEKNKLHIDLAKESNIPIVAFSPIYYLQKKDKKVREVILNIQSNNAGYYEDELFNDADLYLPSLNELKEQFSNIPEALENAKKIEEDCNLEIELNNWVFPDPPFDGDKGVILTNKVQQELKRKGIEETDEVKERLKFELDTITSRGYAPYFLVVYDLLSFAKANNINTTTRGSAAGSLVSYLLGITTINPLVYKLPFERFINPSRPSPPDIDIDFPTDKRNEIINYLKETYGDDHVAQIGTFGAFMARASVRDIARALGYSYATGDQIARYIPMGQQGNVITIEKALNSVDELKELYNTEPDVKHIIDTAKLIEGNVRHISTHAAGVVIAPKKLTNYLAIQKDPRDNNKYITQYQMQSVEDIGLLKFDILGLKNLSIVKNTLQFIKDEGTKIDFDIDNLPDGDRKVFDTLGRGETVGMFQLNGDGMTAFLKRLKPTGVRDISAMIALYRPGPMVNIDTYINRKNKKESIKYLHPKMEEYLKDSYGVLVYQEDVMFTALNLAGYNWETVDAFRKAIGKKIHSEMDKQEKIFIEGCQKYSGVSKKTAEELWKLFDPFKGYGFNKAHAATYGYLAYQTAYLKTYFPVHYMAAVLSVRTGDIKETALYIREAKRLNIDILQPDINESEFDFTPNTKNNNRYIRFGLGSIRKFGENIAENIITERRKGGPFLDIKDFISRMSNHFSSRNSLEALVLSGALDRFGSRDILYRNLDILIEFAKEKRIAQDNQLSLFDASSETIQMNADIEKIPEDEKLYHEKEILGFYISGHPFEKYKSIEKRELTLSQIKTFPNDAKVTEIMCWIGDVKHQTTRKGQRMSVLYLEDETDNLEAACFGKTLATYEEFISPNRCIKITGSISKRGELMSLIVKNISNV